MKKTTTKQRKKVIETMLTRRIKAAEEVAKVHALEETIVFHSKSIENILRREMPKGWKLSYSVELVDNNGKSFCNFSTTAPKDVSCMISNIATFILQELLDKNNIQSHIQNHESDE